MNLQLNVLPPAQRALWDELGAVPGHFVLYGGTAIALQLGHRQSVDYDFFTSQALNPEMLFATISFLRTAVTVRQAPNTLTCRVDRAGPVLVSFMGTPMTRQVNSPCRDPASGVRLATLLDLAGTKASVVQQRAEAKDYVDMDALMLAGISLPQALSAAQSIFGTRFDPQSTLKALCYFGDGDLASLDLATRERLSAAVKAVDLDHLPTMPATATEIGT